MQRGRIKTHPWWQKIKQHLAVTPVVIGVSAVGIVLVVVIFLGYRFNWAWTGFGSFSPPNNNSSFQRGKTLWDWLQLLIIPLVLAIGGYLFNLTVSRNEREATAKRDQNEHDIALDNQQEATLQEYINKMAELLLDKNLRESAVGDEVLKVARARTLTVLPRLNASRKGSVLKFLFEANLLDRDKHIVDLSGADLTYTDLHSADLSDADQRGAYLHGAYLSVMHILFLHDREINMNKVNLSDVDLTKAALSGVELLNLSGTKVTPEQLAQAKSLEGAILPDGSTHP